MRADAFSHKSKRNVLAIAIINIGFILNVENYFPHQQIVENLRIDVIPEGTDQTTYEQYYALTTEGEPVSIVEHAVSIAASPQTHVILLLDWDAFKYEKLKLDHKRYLASSPQFHRFCLDERPGYSKLIFVPKCITAGVYKHFKDIRQ